MESPFQDALIGWATNASRIQIPWLQFPISQYISPRSIPLQRACTTSLFQPQFGHSNFESAIKFPLRNENEIKISFIPLNRARMIRRYLYSHVSSNNRKYACSPYDAVALDVHCNIRIWCRSWISVWFAHFVWTSNSFPSQILQHSGIFFVRNGSLSMEGNSPEVPVDQSIDKTISTKWQLLFTINPPQINSRVIWL